MALTCVSVCIGDKIALAMCVCLCAHVYFLKPRLFPSERLKLTQELSNRLQLIYCFLNSFVLFCDAQRIKAPRGLVGALIQRHLGFPDDALTRVATMVLLLLLLLLFTVVVVAVFVVVVVANDDVTIVTRVFVCLHVLDVVQGCLHLLLEHFVLGTLVH